MAEMSPVVPRRAKPSHAVTSGPAGASISGCAVPMSYTRSFQLSEPESVLPTIRYQLLVFTNTPVIPEISLPFCTRKRLFV